MNLTIKMTKIDYEYYAWLVSQISTPPERTFSALFTIMQDTEFVWTVPNDDNRIHDALELRSEFLNGRNRKINLEGATILEIVVSLSRRIAFQEDEPANQWAWRLIKNLRLHKKHDPTTHEDRVKIIDTLDALVWRTYRKDGRGGFFPLKHPKEDQTKIEIWYQMNQYLIEKMNR